MVVMASDTPSTDSADRPVDDDSAPSRPSSGTAPMNPDDAAAALRRWSTRRMYPIYAVGVAIGLALVAYAATAAVTGSDGSTKLPPSVERQIPEPDANVVAQSMIGIDLRVGYTAALTLNGIPLGTGDGIAVNEQLATVTFKPGAGTSIERLPAGQNCVTASVTSLSQPNAAPTVVNWCFNVA